MSQAHFQLSYPEGVTETRQLPLGRYTLGREGGFAVNHPSISTQHATVDVTDGGVVVTDLGSTNGSFDPNGSRIHGAYPLMPGQTLKVGHVDLTLTHLARNAGTQVLPQMPPLQTAPAQIPAAQVHPMATSHPSSIDAGPTLQGDAAQPQQHCGHCHTPVSPGATVCPGCHAKWGYMMGRNVYDSKFRLVVGRYWAATLVTLTLFIAAASVDGVFGTILVLLGLLFFGVLLLNLLVVGFKLLRGPRWWRSTGI